MRLPETLPFDAPAMNPQERLLRSFPLPESLNPELGTDRFPKPTVADLIWLRELGWSSIGIASIILDQRGSILALSHRSSWKTAEGAVGPLMETTMVGPRGVEPTITTLGRAFKQELQVDIAELELWSPPVGAWNLSAWPRGYLNGEDHVFGINPVVMVSDCSKDLIETSPGSDEISSAKFLEPEAWFREANVRDGAYDWLQGVIISGQLDRALSSSTPFRAEFDKEDSSYPEDADFKRWTL